MNILYALLFFILGGTSVILLEVFKLDAIFDSVRASLGMLFS